MIISNLSYLDTVSQDSEIVGGLALSVALSGARAQGPFFAGTGTATRTVAVDRGLLGNFSTSQSISASVAS